MKTTTCNHAWMLCHVRAAWVCVYCRKTAPTSKATLEANAILLRAAGRDYLTRVKV